MNAAQGSENVKNVVAKTKLARTISGKDERYPNLRVKAAKSESRQVR